MGNASFEILVGASGEWPGCEWRNRPKPMSCRSNTGQCPARSWTRYPQIEANIEPTADVDAARVVFHSENTTDWYWVPMRREGNAWVGTLPRPKGEGARFAYYISARGRGLQERFPDAAALIVDVSATCAEGSLPTSEHGPAELGVPVGAPRMAPGFDTHDVSQFVESQAIEAAPAPPAPSTRFGVTAVLPVPLLSPVRITTAEPPAARIGVIRDDERSITMDVHRTGKPVTWTKAGQRLEGRFESYDDDGALILRLSNAARVRVRAEEPHKPRGTTAWISGAWYCRSTGGNGRRVLRDRGYLRRRPRRQRGSAPRRNCARRRSWCHCRSSDVEAGHPGAALDDGAHARVPACRRGGWSPGCVLSAFGDTLICRSARPRCSRYEPAQRVPVLCRWSSDIARRSYTSVARLTAPVPRMRRCSGPCRRRSGVICGEDDEHLHRLIMRPAA